MMRGATIIRTTDLAVDMRERKQIDAFAVNVVGEDDPTDPAVCIQAHTPTGALLTEWHLNGHDAEILADVIKSEVARQRALARPN